MLTQRVNSQRKGYFTLVYLFCFEFKSHEIYVTKQDEKQTSYFKLSSLWFKCRLLDKLCYFTLVKFNSNKVFGVKNFARQNIFDRL